MPCVISKVEKFNFALKSLVLSEMTNMSSMVHSGFPCTLENLEKLENEEINFQAWKSPGEKKNEKCPGKILEILLKYILN